jgi:hypothetical protein
MATWRHGCAAVRGRQRPEGGWASWAAKGQVGPLFFFSLFSEIASSLLFLAAFFWRKLREKFGRYLKTHFETTFKT